MAWTDERVELLKKLWGEGLSASQIAGRLGAVTRNAVIGKVHRLGLSGRATTSRMKSHRPRARIANAKRAKAKAEQHVELNTAVIRREVGISDATSERLYSKQVADEEAKYEAERRRILAEHEAANHPAASPGLLNEAAHMLAKPVEQRDRAAFTDMAMKLFETALDLRRTSNAADADAHEHMAR